MPEADFVPSSGDSRGTAFDKETRMLRPGTDHPGRRAATRLLAIGSMALAMVAGPVAVGPVSAGPADTTGGNAALSPSDPAAAVDSTVCTAERSGFGAATGSCEDPASHLSFRVLIRCRHWATGDLYDLATPLESTFETVHAFCSDPLNDEILAWDTQIVQTGEPDPPPVINSLTCQVPNRIDISCSLSATDWTQIRWTVDGHHVSAWNNRTSVQGNCMEIISSDPIVLIEVRDVTVRVAVSNAAGTTHRQDNVRCLAIG